MAMMWYEDMELFMFQSHREGISITSSPLIILYFIFYNRQLDNNNESLVISR